jgi:hypothetical protein
MSPTTLIPASIAADLAATLNRLRAARSNGDISAELVAETRLNYLLDRLDCIP